MTKKATIKDTPTLVIALLLAPLTALRAA